jgi:hypothetical protein
MSLLQLADRYGRYGAGGTAFAYQHEHDESTFNTVFRGPVNKPRFPGRRFVCLDVGCNIEETPVGISCRARQEHLGFPCIFVYIVYIHSR